MIDKIKLWFDKRRAENLAQKILIQIDFFIEYQQKYAEKINQHIIDFEEKFYPEEAKKRKRYNNLLKDEVINLEDLKETGFTLTEKDISLIKKQIKKGSSIQSEGIFIKKESINNFTRALENVEEFSKKFNEYKHKNLEFKTSINISFSNILNLPYEDIILLQNGIFPKIRVLKDIDFKKVLNECSTLKLDDATFL